MLNKARLSNPSSLESGLSSSLATNRKLGQSQIVALILYNGFAIVKGFYESESYCTIYNSYKEIF